jgi:hypothetical protein
VVPRLQRIDVRGRLVCSARRQRILLREQNVRGRGNSGAKKTAFSNFFATSCGHKTYVGLDVKDANFLCAVNPSMHKCT